MGQILGIAAPARSGKDTICRFLESRYRFTTDSFMAPVREFVARILNVSIEELEQIKDQPVKWLQGRTPRHMTQTCGFEWGREMIAPQIWIESLWRRQPVRGMQHRLVVSDVRIEDEADSVRAAGGVVIHLSRPDAENVESHKTERSIIVRPEDIVIVNDGTLMDLYRQVEAALRMIGSNAA